jgi:hypothetical protein
MVTGIYDPSIDKIDLGAEPFDQFSERFRVWESCEGSLLYDAEGTPYLDLQIRRRQSH